MKRIAIAGLAAFAAAFPSVASARPLLHCKPTHADNVYAVGDIVADHAAGCQFADMASALWQKDIAWSGDGHASKYISLTRPGRPTLYFTLSFAAFQGSQDPIMRVQAHQEQGPMFFSFMTDQ